MVIVAADAGVTSTVTARRRVMTVIVILIPAVTPTRRTYTMSVASFL